MRRRYGGYILPFTRADHGGRHIHVYRDNRQIGVYDRIDGPIRGLDREWGAQLQSAIEDFLEELDARGY